MPRTREEQLAYARGYAAGAKWPEHRPPHPPEPLIKELCEKAERLRNCVDSILSVLDPEDDWHDKYGPAVDGFDDLMMRVGQWLKRKELEVTDA